jgi:GT2 family glycosyltransferase
MADEASGKKEMCLKKIKIGLIKKINETLQGITPYLKNKNIAYRTFAEAGEAMGAMNVAVESPSQPRILATIPAYNEAGYIEAIIKKTQQYVDRVVVVDDGSSDGTSRYAARAGADVVLHEPNKGYGEAIKSCFDAANRLFADIVVTMDGDGQHDPQDLPAIIGPIMAGQADIVIGSRFLNNNNRVPAYRKLGIKAITGLYNVFSSMKMSDAQSGFRAYNKKALALLLPLQEKGMPISTEIIIKARKLGLRVVEVPITVIYHGESSTINPVAHGLSVAMATIRQRFQIELNSDKRGSAHSAVIAGRRVDVHRCD